jgi:hypothetical protein
MMIDERRKNFTGLGVQIMKAKSFLPLLLLGFVASAPAPKPSNTITGDYLEARTASVFCGACHYNGELVTEGRDAILAWDISHGSWNGVDLSGVRAMATIACDRNLSDATADRSTEIVIDKSASDAQAVAMADLIRSTGSSNLGRVLITRRAVVSFKHEGGNYTVSADGYADMTVQALPNNECCTQPHLVWYTPLMPIEHRKVGYTEAADYIAGTNGDTWQREDENSAFYGSIDLPGK